jgi:hypothetical protein
MGAHYEHFGIQLRLLQLRLRCCDLIAGRVSLQRKDHSTLGAKRIAPAN